MNYVLIAGIIVVNLALLSYSVAAWRLYRRPVSRRSLIILSAGVAFDIVATVCMIAGSPESPFTLHGILGYSALGAMLTDAVLLWRSWSRNSQATLSKALGLYSKLAYGWWVVAYITGALLVAFRRSTGA